MTRVFVEIDRVVVRGAGGPRAEAVRLQVERAVVGKLGGISAISAHAPRTAGAVAERVSNAIVGGGRRG